MNTVETPEQKVLRLIEAYNKHGFNPPRETLSKPVEIQKPNVELFDDPQHNGQYYGD